MIVEAAGQHFIYLVLVLNGICRRALRLLQVMYLFTISPRGGVVLFCWLVACLQVLMVGIQ